MFLFLLKLLPLALCLFGIWVFCYIAQNWTEAVVASIGSCIGAVIACLFSYHYSLYKREYQLYLDSARRCIWHLTQNQRMLELIEKQPSIDILLVACHLKDIEPFMQDRFPLLDDGFRDQLLQCQTLISQVKVSPNLATEHETLMTIRFTISSAAQEIKFIKFAYDNVFVWFLLPYILNYLRKRFYSVNGQDQA